MISNLLCCSNIYMECQDDQIEHSIEPMASLNLCAQHKISGRKQITALEQQYERIRNILIYV